MDCKNVILRLLFFCALYIPQAFCEDMQPLQVSSTPEMRLSVADTVNHPPATIKHSKHHNHKQPASQQDSASLLLVENQTNEMLQSANTSLESSQQKQNQQIMATDVKTQNVKTKDDSVDGYKNPNNVAISILSFLLSFGFAYFAYKEKEYDKKNKKLGNISDVPSQPAAPRTPPQTVTPHSKYETLGADVVALSSHAKTLLQSVEQKIEESNAVIEAQKKTLDTLSIERAKISTGLVGEKNVLNFLKTVISADGTIIEGFLGGKGEIDFLVICSKGVFAFEVKTRGGTVSCDGNNWTLTKSNGQIEQIKDNGGRSPARQLDESAGWLEAELAKAGFVVKIPRAIILAHPKAKIGSITNPGIQGLILLAVNATNDLRKLLTLGTPLEWDQMKEIVHLIKLSHKC